MIAGGTKKRAFGWQSKMGMSNSYRTGLKRNYEMSLDYDKLVVSWKEEHEKEYKDMLELALDPSNEISLKTFRQTNPAQTHYQVRDNNKNCSSIKINYFVRIFNIEFIIIP